MLSIYLLALETEEERLTMTKLYNRHSLFMLRYALKVTKNQELAEDAVHDAFLKIIDKKEKYFSLSCSDFRVRIVSIVKNRCIDILKRKGRLYDDIDDFVETIESNDKPIEDQMIIDEDYKALRKNLEELDESSRLILEMKYLLGMSSKEIGHELGITPKHIDTKVYRAKAKLIKMSGHDKGDSPYEY